MKSLARFFLKVATASLPFCVIGSVSALGALDAVSLRLSLTHPNPETNGGFGRAVAAVGDNVLVGALTTDFGANGSGVAYLFDRSNGNLIRTIPSPNPQSNALFGTAVAAFRDNLLISTLSTGTGGRKPGIAYLIDSHTGEVIHSFVSPVPSIDDGYGISLASVGDIIAVGAIIDDSQAPNSGVVHLYSGISGQYLRTLNNPNPRAEDRFGVDIAALGDDLVVGSTGDLTGPGAVYVFDPTTGSLLRQIDNPTPAAADEFGRAVAIDGDNILVGAPLDDTQGPDVGAVYRFDGATGELVDTIWNPLPHARDSFGSAIGVSRHSIAIGAPLKTHDSLGDIGFELGGVFFFDRVTNHFVEMVLPTTPNRQDRFGMDIEGIGTDIVVGHGLDDAKSQDDGTVLVYSIPEPISSILLVCMLAAFPLQRVRRRRLAVHRYATVAQSENS